MRVEPVMSVQWRTLGLLSQPIGALLNVSQCATGLRDEQLYQLITLVTQKLRVYISNSRVFFCP